MFAYLRKRSLGCEQLEGRFAPSSVLVGGGSRSTFKDAQALETTQAEQAAFYLAASAVVSQSSSVADVAPITFDQPAAGEAERSQDSDNGGCPSRGLPMNCCPPGGWGPYIDIWAGDFSPVPQPTADGTGSDGQPADDSGSTPDVPSVDPVSPETPSEQGNDADAVGTLPSEALPAGGDDVAAEDFPPVVDDTPAAGDEVSEPVVEDAGLPDAADPEEMPWVGNDFEDLGPVEPVDTDTEFTDENGSNELTVDEVPAEYQSDDAEDEVAPVDA
jgi:hypothetical protein